MQAKHPLYDLLAPVIEAAGFEVWRMMTIGLNRPTLQIMIEAKDGREIDVEDCAKVSRLVSEKLDEKDPIESEYTLEVSSPGLDRPLVTFEHFARFAGYEAKAETSREIDGRKRFKGKISRAENGIVYFCTDGQEYALPYEDIAKAKLVLTDELLKEYEEVQQGAEE